VVLFEPDSGNMGDEIVGVQWESGSTDSVSTLLQERGEFLAVVDVKCATFDAACRGAELRCCKSASGGCCGDCFRGLPPIRAAGLPFTTISKPSRGPLGRMVTLRTKARKLVMSDPRSSSAAA